MELADEPDDDGELPELARLLDALELESDELTLEELERLELDSLERLELLELSGNRSIGKDSKPKLGGRETARVWQRYWRRRPFPRTVISQRT